MNHSIGSGAPPEITVEEHNHAQMQVRGFLATSGGDSVGLTYMQVEALSCKEEATWEQQFATEW